MWTRSGVSGTGPGPSKGDKKKTNGSSANSKRSSRSDASKSSSRSVNQDLELSRSNSDPSASAPTKSYKHSSTPSGRQTRAQDSDDGDAAANSQQLSHDSSLIPNQFPDQTPLDYSIPSIRPDDSAPASYGLAADYYNDQGESVHRQPGVRPHTPIVTGTEPHLMAALAQPNPPEETGHGAAAEFYGGATSAPSEASYQTAPSHGQAPYSSSIAAGAAATSVAALTSSSGATAASGIAGSQRPSKKPSKQSASSMPLIAAGAAVGAAGLGAAAYAHHTKNHVASSHSSRYSASNSTARPVSGRSSSSRAQAGRPPPVPYAAGMTKSYQEQHHEHRGPITKFVDWWKNYDDVRKMEEYTEYIGVCRYCFDPYSDPRDGPRKHRPHKRPSREFLDRRRVDKETRYTRASSVSSSDEGGNKGVLAAAGLAGLGLASASKAKRRRDFDDNSVKAGWLQSEDPLDPSQRRPENDRWSSTSQGVIRRDSRSQRGQTRSSEQDTRGSVLAGAAATAAAVGGIGIAETAEQTPPSVRRKSSRVINGRTRIEPSSSTLARASSSDSDSSVGFFGKLFSPNSKKSPSRRRRSSSAVYQNDSATSSLVSGLAYGREDSQIRRGKSRREPTARDASNAILGLGTAAALLASVDSKRNRPSTRRPELIAVRESRNMPSKPPLTRDSLNQIQQESDDGWEDESDSARSSSVDSGLAFGDFHLGRHASARQSSTSINSAGSATDKWNWRWGGKTKQKRRTSTSDDPRQASGTVLPTIVASPPIMADSVSVASRHRADSVADYDGQGPLRYIDPRPVSDFNSPDAADPFPKPPVLADVRNVALQQPQPKPAVRPSTYDNAEQFDRLVSRSRDASGEHSTPRLTRVETLPDNFGDSPFPDGYSFPKRRRTDPVSSGGSRESPIGSHRIDSPRRESRSEVYKLARDAATTGAIAAGVGVAAAAMDRNDKRNSRQGSQSVRFATDESTEDYRRGKTSRNVRDTSFAEPAGQETIYQTPSKRVVEPPANVPEPDLPMVDRRSQSGAASGETMDFQSVDGRKDGYEELNTARNVQAVSSLPPIIDDMPTIPGAFNQDLVQSNDLVHVQSEPQFEIRHQGQIRTDHEPILDDEIFDPNFFKRSRAASEPQSEGRHRTASIVVADLEKRYTSKSPSMAEFFAPPELTSHESSLDKRVDVESDPMTHRDSMDASMGSRGFAAMATSPTIQTRAISSIPRLNVIAPTPPSSYAGSAKDPHSRSATPEVPVTEVEETSMERAAGDTPSSSARVRWADQPLKESSTAETRVAEPKPATRDIQGTNDASGTSAESYPEPPLKNDVREAMAPDKGTASGVGATDEPDTDQPSFQDSYAYDVAEVRPKAFTSVTIPHDEDVAALEPTSSSQADRATGPHETQIREPREFYDNNGQVDTDGNLPRLTTPDEQSRSDQEITGGTVYENWNDVPPVEPEAEQPRSSKKGKKSKKRRSQPSAAPWEEEAETDSGRRSRVPEEKVNTSFQKKLNAVIVDMSQPLSPETDVVTDRQAELSTQVLPSSEGFSLSADRSTDSLLELERGLQQTSPLEDKHQSVMDAYSFPESYRDIPEMIRLPDSRPGSPYGPDDVQSTQDNSEAGRSPSSPTAARTPSATAVPLPFYRRTPQSPWSNRDSPFPLTNDQSPTSATRTRTSRPSSMDFKSNEFRPLYLLERNRKANQTDPDEDLPPLPSSHSTSRASSVLDSDEIFESARESLEASPVLHHSSYDQEDAFEHGLTDTGYLDSQQATPKALALSEGISEVPSQPLDGNNTFDPVKENTDRQEEDGTLRSTSESLGNAGTRSDPLKVDPHQGAEELAEEGRERSSAAATKQNRSTSVDPTVMAAVVGETILAPDDGNNVLDSRQEVVADPRSAHQIDPSETGTDKSIAVPVETSPEGDSPESRTIRELDADDEKDSWSTPLLSRSKKGKKSKKAKKGRPTPIQTTPNVPESETPTDSRMDDNESNDDGVTGSSGEHAQLLSKDQPVVDPPLTATRDSYAERALSDGPRTLPEGQSTERDDITTAKTEEFEEHTVHPDWSTHEAPASQRMAAGDVMEDLKMEDLDLAKTSHPDHISSLDISKDVDATSFENRAEASVGDPISRQLHSDTLTETNENGSSSALPIAPENSILPHNRPSNDFEQAYAREIELRHEDTNEKNSSEMVPKPASVVETDRKIPGGWEEDHVEETVVEDETELLPADYLKLDNLINRRQSESQDRSNVLENTSSSMLSDETPQAIAQLSSRYVQEPENRFSDQEPGESKSQAQGSVEIEAENGREDEDQQEEDQARDVENFSWVSKSKKKDKKGKKGTPTPVVYEPKPSRQISPPRPLTTATDPDEEWALSSSKKKKKKGKGGKASLALAAFLGASAVEATSSVQDDLAGESASPTFDSQVDPESDYEHQESAELGAANKSQEFVSAADLEEVTTNPKRIDSSSKSIDSSYEQHAGVSSTENVMTTENDALRDVRLETAQSSVATDASISSPVDTTGDDEWALPSKSQKKKDKKKKKASRMAEPPLNNMDDEPAATDLSTKQTDPETVSTIEPIEPDPDDEWAMASDYKSKKGKKKIRFSTEPNEDTLADQSTITSSLTGSDVGQGPSELIESRKSVTFADEDTILPTESSMDSGSKTVLEEVVSPNIVPGAFPDEELDSMDVHSTPEDHDMSTTAYVEEADSRDFLDQLREEENQSPVPKNIRTFEFPGETATEGLVHDERQEQIEPSIHVTETRPEVERTTTSEFLEELREEENQSPRPSTTTASYADRDLPGEPSALEERSQVEPNEQHVAEEESIQTLAETSIGDTFGVDEVNDRDVREGHSDQQHDTLVAATEQVPQADDDEWAFTSKKKKKKKTRSTPESTSVAETAKDFVTEPGQKDSRDPSSDPALETVTADLAEGDSKYEEPEEATDEWDLAPKSKKKQKRSKNKDVVEPTEYEPTDIASTETPMDPVSTGTASSSTKGKKNKKDKKSKGFSLLSIFQGKEQPKKSKSSKAISIEQSDSNETAEQTNTPQDSSLLSGDETAENVPVQQTEEFMQQEDALEEGYGESYAGPQLETPDADLGHESIPSPTDGFNMEVDPNSAIERNFEDNGTISGSYVESTGERTKDDYRDERQEDEVEEMLEEERAMEDGRLDADQYSNEIAEDMVIETEAEAFLDEGKALEEDIDPDVTGKDRDSPVANFGKDRQPLLPAETLDSESPLDKDMPTFTASKKSKKEKKKAKKARKNQPLSIDEFQSREENDDEDSVAAASLAQALLRSDDDRLTGLDSTKDTAAPELMDTVETSSSEKPPTSPVTSSAVMALPTFVHDAEIQTANFDQKSFRRSQSISKLLPLNPSSQVEITPRSSSESRKSLVHDSSFTAALEAGLRASGFDPNLSLHRSLEEQRTITPTSTSATKVGDLHSSIEGSRQHQNFQEPSWSFSKLDAEADDEPQTEQDELVQKNSQKDDPTFNDIVSLGLGSAGFDPRTTIGDASSEPAVDTATAVEPDSKEVENEVGGVTMRTPSPKGPAEQWLNSSRQASPVSEKPEHAGGKEPQETDSHRLMTSSAEDDSSFTLPSQKKSKKKKEKRREKARREMEESWVNELQEQEGAPSGSGSGAQEASGELDDMHTRSINRDSAMHMPDSPQMSVDSPNQQTVRDSGYHDTMPATPASRTFEFQRDSKDMDMNPNTSPTARISSPVESTSKERTSSLFQSPPNFATSGAPSKAERGVLDDETPITQAINYWDPSGLSRHENLQPTVEDEDDASRGARPIMSSPSGSLPVSSAGHYRTPSRELDTINEDTLENLDVEPKGPQPSHGSEASATYGGKQQSGQTIFPPNEASSQLSRNIISPTGSEIANSRRAYARSPGNASPVADLVRPGSALSARSRTPGSAVSNRSGSQVLRRSNPSSDLGAEYKRGEAQAPGYPANAATDNPFSGSNTAVEQPPSYDPLKGSGRVSSRDMSDTGVYEGWGDVRESPRSPTRPQSVRKRQSLQIIDLENRLDQVMAENRSLQDGSGLAGSSRAREFSDGMSTASRDEELRRRDVEINTIKASLETLQQEIARLTEHNEQLTEANRNLSEDANQRYAKVQAEHDDVHQQWQQTSRELQQERESHTALKTGMEAAVGAQVSSTLASKNAEIQSLKDELSAATEQIRSLQSQIQESSSSSRGVSGAPGTADDFLNVRTEDYIDSACHQLCSHVQQWILRFSKFSDMRACRLSRDLRNESIEARLDNAVLDGTDVDTYLSDRIKRRDVFMSLTMTMIWEYVFTRYLFGMERTQRQTLKNLEKTLSEVGPQRAVAQWRATTLTLLSRRENFAKQRETDTEAVVQEIFSTLSALLPPPHSLVNQIVSSLRNVLRLAVDLSIEMRTQRPEYVMLPPLHPEYDTNGDLVRKVFFNASLMNERSGLFADNGALEVEERSVRIVLFPLVVRKGDEFGEGSEEVVVAPAQVLVSRTEEEERRSTGPPRGNSANSSARSVRGLGGEHGNRSQMSIAPSGMGMDT